MAEREALTPLDAGYRKPRADPHITVDFLRGLAPGLTKRFEEAEAKTGYGGLTEGMLRAMTPETPTEIPLMALGPAGKVFGKAGVKAAGATTAALAGMSDAEAATPLQKTLFDLLRKHKGDVQKAQAEIMAMRPTLPQGQRGPATQLGTKPVADALVKRELMTNPDVPNVWDLVEGRRQQTLLTPEQAFKVGDIAVPLSGDTSHAGRMVKRAGIDLKTPVEMQGGHEYGLSPRSGGAPWSSEYGAANTKQKGFERAAQEAKGDVLGVHVAMAPEGSYFAKHIPALWREMLRSGPRIAKEDLAAFGEDVPKLLTSKQTQHVKQHGRESPMIAEALRFWPGMSNKKALDALLNENPEARKALMETGFKPGWQMKGFPDMDRLFAASLDEGLQVGDTGGGIMRAAPGEPLTPSQHDTYGFNFPGKHVGRLEVPIPAERMFPEVAAARGNQLLGSLRNAYWAKPITQQHLDDMMNYTEAQKKLLRTGSY